MKRLHVCFPLTLALLLLVSGALVPARGAAADSSMPAGLTPAARQAIQGQVAKLTAADGADYDLFGIAVAVSGDTAVVGADNADVGGNTDQGAAYVFDRDQGCGAR